MQLPCNPLCFTHEFEIFFKIPKMRTATAGICRHTFGNRRDSGYEAREGLLGSWFRTASVGGSARI